MHQCSVRFGRDGVERFLADCCLPICVKSWRVIFVLSALTLNLARMRLKLFFLSPPNTYDWLTRHITMRTHHVHG